MNFFSLHKKISKGSNRFSQKCNGTDFSKYDNQRVRIGIDARALLIKKRTGVERMLFHFVESLFQIGKDYEYVLFVDDNIYSKIFSRQPYRIIVEPVHFPLLQRLCDVWIFYQTRKLIKKYRIDLFFSPHTKFPITSIPRVTTIHGLEWYFYPSGYPLVEKIKQWFWFQLCSRFSSGIITFTHNTYKDIRKIRLNCPIPICIVSEGIDPGFRRLNSEEISSKILDRLKVRPPFILSVCSLEPRKNLDALIRAFATVMKKNPIPHRLVLAGKAGWKAERLKALTASLGIENLICFTGYVADEELVQLYNQASLFVYPSKYEGFGLPILEAMACGLPIVTSNKGALAEVAANAAILVDPFSDKDLAEGIIRGLIDTSLRNSLISSGLERVSQFSWNEMTSKILNFMTSGLKSYEKTLA